MGFFAAMQTETDTASCPRTRKYPHPRFASATVGQRYYSCGESRWISRDPSVRHEWWSLYRFCRSAPIGYFDALGLEAATKEDCETLKESVKIKKPADKALKDILDYLDKRKCSYDVSCEECPCSICGKGSASGGGRGKVCKVTICAYRHSGFTDLGRTFHHEFIHCRQRCDKEHPGDCISCLCREIEAYSKSGECVKHSVGSQNWYECLKKAARSSCTGVTPQGDKFPCEETAPEEVQGILSNEFVDKCATDGTAPPTNPSGK